ncbi:hypothetical protein AVEN_60295-1 [Araneus ventricosus]|uniref:Calcineurin-like phosphoesterase domain-containing protein n=1 Tax=Araneus ventricosus TaxID=182803 RepID=A0A4Y2TZB6_ARAVE|nr:hypothetical protein AVEN_60295-1 [Araneus ventricosus]
MLEKQKLLTQNAVNLDSRNRPWSPKGRLRGLFWYPRLGWVPLLTYGTQPNRGYQNRYLSQWADSAVAHVRAVFCGHWHGNAGGFYKDLEVVVTSAIGGQLRGDRSGLRVVKVSDSAIRHNYYALEDVPKEISLD